MINVAVLGYGTVGSGVVEVIEKNKEEIDKKSGEKLSIKYILDLRDFPGDPYENKVVHYGELIMNDPEVQVICETMGGIHPAYEFSKRALMMGKSVCTSNKELVANHGPELIRLAKEHKCNYLFEASVGGVIPIIRPINYSLTAEKIDGITGILNGTTNYMLTKMDREGLDYIDVLKEAQHKGYAELHPEADVEGWDACRKIAILTSLASGSQVDYRDIYTEGITKITTRDFAYAKKMNRAIKLLAISRKVGDTYCVMVSPALIHREHPLYMVNDVFNAVFVEGNMLGTSMFYGSGAGKLPTASAVAGDIVDAARHLGKIITLFWEPEKLELAPMEQMTRRFFVRMKEGAEPEAYFGDGERIDARVPGEFGFITPVMSEAEYAAKAAGAEIISMLRVEG